MKTSKTTTLKYIIISNQLIRINNLSISPIQTELAE